MIGYFDAIVIYLGRITNSVYPLYLQYFQWFCQKYFSSLSIFGIFSVVLSLYLQFTQNDCYILLVLGKKFYLTLKY